MCFDLDYEQIKSKLPEDEMANAQNALNEAPIDEEGVINE